MDIIDWNTLDSVAQAACLTRPALQNENLAEQTARLIAQVRADGDATLRALTRRFDNVELAHIAVSPAEFSAAEASLSEPLKAAIVNAHRRITAFHRAGAPKPYALETQTGVQCERIIFPIERVGLYVPAGSAPLPSTALMLGVPAQIAGCDSVLLCSPPQSDGCVHAAVLFAAKLCGITQVYKLGGVQAIAAMAYGTESLPKCDKIFGPGNAWVTQAKQLVSQDPLGASIDMPAGPSEVLVIADAQANAHIVAADLLSQAEHGPDSQVVLVSDSRALLQAVQAAIDSQLEALPRAGIASTALAFARLILVKDLPQALHLSNAYAPEHLILNVAEPRNWLSQVKHAGSIFLGANTPESVGDYNSGTNHVLPTYGWARSISGVSVASFVRLVTVQELSPAGLQNIGLETIELARAERLDAHAHAVQLRLELMAQNQPNVINDANDVTPTLALLRPDVQRMKGYSSARMEAKAAQVPQVMLNANEAPDIGPVDDLPGLNRYPEPQPEALRKALAEHYQIEPEQLLIGRGSDEAIDLLTRGFCRAEQDAVVIMPPTFGMYSVCAQVQGARVIELPLLRFSDVNADFQPDFAGLKSLLASEPSIKLVYFCTPNNPTGSEIARADLRAVLLATRGRCVVVVDEAYQEYSTLASVSSWLAEFNHLAVLRTLSKAHALAGARIGCLLAHPGIISALRKLMAPYPIPAEASAAALQALMIPALLNRRVSIAKQERQRLMEAMHQLAGIVKLWPSSANFLCFQVGDAHSCYQSLLAQNVVVRNVSHYPGLKNCLRVSVGSVHENNLFLTAIRTALEERAA